MPACEIELSRDAGHYTDWLRAYKVFVDGRQVASIKRGASASVEVEPGPHEVQLRIDWCRSPTLTVDAAPGRTIRLRCRPNAHPLLALFFISAGRDRYIRLYEESDAQPAPGVTR